MEQLNGGTSGTRKTGKQGKQRELDSIPQVILIFNATRSMCSLQLRFLFIRIATIMDKSPWDSNAIIICSCHFSVPS